MPVNWCAILCTFLIVCLNELWIQPFNSLYLKWAKVPVVKLNVFQSVFKVANKWRHISTSILSTSQFFFPGALLGGDLNNSNGACPSPVGECCSLSIHTSPGAQFLRLCKGDRRRQVSGQYDRDAVEVKGFDQRSILQAVSVSLSPQFVHTQTRTC